MNKGKFTGGGSMQWNVPSGNNWMCSKCNTVNWETDRYCMNCGKAYGPEHIRDSQGVPLCACGGRIKPDVVLYEEGLDEDVLAQSIHHLRQADTLIVAGTSLTVYPAAGLIRYFKGRHLVLINRDATPMDGMATLIIRENVGQVLSRLTV